MTGSLRTHGNGAISIWSNRDWVLDTAAEATHGPPSIKLAVNVSPVQFRSHAFSLKVANALATSGLSANITEAVLIRDDEAALTMLQHLRAIGVLIALDDWNRLFFAELSAAVSI